MAVEFPDVGASTANAEAAKRRVVRVDLVMRCIVLFCFGCLFGCFWLFLVVVVVVFCFFLYSFGV